MSPPMIVVLGCTACGKSQLAFELAKMLQGDILSIDSMKVYRRMDIGTAKPDPKARMEIPHHLIDVVEPWEPFSLGRFIELADLEIENIKKMNRPIIAVGGTAMYIRGLIEGIFEGPPASQNVRNDLLRQADQMGLNRLYERLKHIDPDACEKIHPNDQKRIIRALEVYELTGRAISSFQTQFGSGKYRHPWRLIGVRRDKQDNNSRINLRVKRMVDKGLVDEVKSLMEHPEGLSPQAAQAVGYAEIISHFKGQCSLDEAIEQIKINTRRLAKSQRTWFRSFRDVNWFDLNKGQSSESLIPQMMKFIEQSWAND